MQAPRERDQLLEGTRALESSDWEAARATFEAALEISETPDALDGLGLALCFLGRREEGIAARERAFEGFVRERRCNEAAQVAVWVSHQHLVAGRGSAARGWLARAERALEGVPGCAGHGWVAIERTSRACAARRLAGLGARLAPVIDPRRRPRRPRRRPARARHAAAPPPRSSPTRSSSGR